ncbi:MAG: M28 family peptidase [Bryobacteraceae bacterium]|jgi:Zn-dependent M28 family amino/carboxypeptidase
MHRNQALVMLAALSLWAQKPARSPIGFSGSSALAFTARAVSFGPRPPGSEPIRRLQDYIVGQLKLVRCEITVDPFTAQTPLGPVRMQNIIAHFRGTSGRAVAVTGHYDTKSMPGRSFVGANDGGSSTGFLLELARVLGARPLKDDVYLVWLDGEEALVRWSESDGIYGSRHLAARWSADGTIGRLKALINVDMIGDRDLGILREMNSSEWLRELAWSTAAELGLSSHFLKQAEAVEDDHVPFLLKGVHALDLIDFNYGPDNSYWHTDQDTMDKLSAESFQVVGAVVLEMLKKLE